MALPGTKGIYFPAKERSKKLVHVTVKKFQRGSIGKFRQHHVAAVPHNIDGSFVFLSILLMSRDQPPSARQHAQGIVMRANVANAFVDRAKLALVAGENLVQREARPSSSRAWIRTKKYIRRLEPAVAQPNVRNS